MNTIPVKEKPLMLKGMVRIIGTKAGTKEIVSDSGWMPNLIMQGSYTGMSLILSALADDQTYPAINLTWIGIGTSNTAPAITDTALGTETTRSAVSSNQQVTVATGALVVQAFIPDSQLANATYYESGSFIGGSSSVNTGQIFNHILFASPYVKGSGQDTTIQMNFNISQ